MQYNKPTSVYISSEKLNARLNLTVQSFQEGISLLDVMVAANANAIETDLFVRLRGGGQVHDPDFPVTVLEKVDDRFFLQFLVPNPDSSGVGEGWYCTILDDCAKPKAPIVIGAKDIIGADYFEQRGCDGVFAHKCLAVPSSTVRLAISVLRDKDFPKDAVNSFRWLYLGIV